MLGFHHKAPTGPRNHHRFPWDGAFSFFSCAKTNFRKKKYIPNKGLPGFTAEARGTLVLGGGGVLLAGFET